MEEKIALQNGKAWLKKEIRPYRVFIVFLTVFSVVTTLLSLAFAYIVKFLIDSASNGQAQLLTVFSIVILGLLLIRIALQTFANYQAEKLRAKIVVDLRKKIFSKILRSNYASVQKYHSGELINRLTADIQEVAADSVGLLPALVGIAVQCVGAITALLTINPMFTAVYVVCGAIFGGVMALFRKHVKKSHKEVLETDGSVRSFMQESITSTMTLKAYSAEDKTLAKADDYTSAYYEKRMKRNVLRSSMSAVFTLLSNFGLIFAVVWCSIIVLNGSREYGSILSIILLLMQLQHPFSAFSSIMPAYYARQASGERLQEIDAFPCEDISKGSNGEDIPYESVSSFSVENVSFSYGRESIFNDASCSLKKGDIVCLTGASGAGKSTIFKLLLNVYAPLEGGIYAVATTGEKTLISAKHRELFAYVPQGNFLFSGTIYENLTFFCDETDGDTLQEKVKAALQTACADFVWDLPQGLQTPLGEKGVGLSEGQTQRLAVARAILSNRPVLLLDEATSALDSETEQKLLQNIKALNDKTCLIVTHRPAALEIADSILSVENGKIIIQ
jgi:ATP-binding cassette subfamily B protein